MDDEPSALHKAHFWPRKPTSWPSWPSWPTDLHLPEELASPQRYESSTFVWNCPALFFIPTLQIPLPSTWPLSKQSFSIASSASHQKVLFLSCMCRRSMYSLHPQFPWPCLQCPLILGVRQPKHGSCISGVHNTFVSTAAKQFRVAGLTSFLCLNGCVRSTLRQQRCREHSVACR